MKERSSLIRMLIGILPLAGIALFGSCSGSVHHGTTVDVDLREFTVVPSATEAPAGTVHFVVHNVGTEAHEFLVIRTDLPPDSLPTEPDGSVNEEGPGIEVLEEIPEFPAGETMTLTLDLPAANYVLICNRVENEDGETVSHYHEGMRVGFLTR